VGVNPEFKSFSKIDISNGGSDLEVKKSLLEKACFSGWLFSFPFYRSSISPQ